MSYRSIKNEGIIVTSFQAIVSHGLERDYLHYILFHNNKRTLPPRLFISFQFNFLNVPLNLLFY